MRQLLDVVRHAIQLPLPVDFLFAAQRKAVEPLVRTQVAEDRFHRRKTLTDAPAPGRTIDARFHLLDPVLARVTPAEEEGHLAGDRLLRFAQALAAQAAGLAILLRPLKFHRPVAVDRALAAIAVGSKRAMASSFE